jgi:hypothetical protein
VLSCALRPSPNFHLCQIQRVLTTVICNSSYWASRLSSSRIDKIQKPNSFKPSLYSGRPSLDRETGYTEMFMVFLTHYSQTVRQYLKTGHPSHPWFNVPKNLKWRVQIFVTNMKLWHSI